MRQAVTRAEAIDAAVLEETTDDRFDPDVLGQPRQARPQAADAAHHKIDRNAGTRGLVQHVDDLGVDQRIILHPNRGPATVAGDRSRAGAIPGWMCSQRGPRGVSGETAILSSPAGSA